MKCWSCGIVIAWSENGDCIANPEGAPTPHDLKACWKKHHPYIFYKGSAKVPKFVYEHYVQVLGYGRCMLPNCRICIEVAKMDSSQPCKKEYMQ